MKFVAMTCAFLFIALSPKLKKWACSATGGEQIGSNGRATVMHHNGGGKWGPFQRL